MSRYMTPYTSAGVPKFATLVTNTSSINTATTARRITVLVGAVPHFMTFGTSTIVATAAGVVLPAHSCLDFNMTTGTHIAFLSSSGASTVTVIDAD